MTSLNIPSGKESEDLPYLYWIPKLHKTPYKERYIAGSSTITYLSWREERHLAASWSLNTDLGRLLTQFLSLWIQPCTRDLIVLTQFNISNILNRKEVVKEIPPYFKNQSVPIVSYSYSIGRKIFNYKEALQDINIEEYLKNPRTLTQDLGLLLSLSTFWHNLICSHCLL
jgi:hypothetical protein